MGVFLGCLRIVRGVSEGRLGEIECVWWSLLVSLVSGVVFGCLERCLSVSMSYAARDVWAAL